MPQIPDHLTNLIADYNRHKYLPSVSEVEDQFKRYYVNRTFKSVAYSQRQGRYLYIKVLTVIVTNDYHYKEGSRKVRIDFICAPIQKTTGLRNQGVFGGRNIHVLLNEFTYKYEEFTPKVETGTLGLFK